MQDDPLKLGVDMDMFHMNGSGGFQQSHLSSERNGGGAWHRDQVRTDTIRHDVCL